MDENVRSGPGPPDSFLNLPGPRMNRDAGRGGEMVTMVTMVLSWSRALSVRSGGRPTGIVLIVSRHERQKRGGEGV